MKKFLIVIISLVLIITKSNAQNDSTAKHTKKDTVIRSLPSPLQFPPLSNVNSRAKTH
jgi:hypothetical protein